MATEVTLPALGESVTEGTVTRWLKQVGDEIAVDDALLEVSTDKVDTEIPSPVAGTLLEIRADEDETVEVGAVLALVGSADEAGTSSGGGDAAPSAETETEASETAAEFDAEDAPAQADPEPSAPAEEPGDAAPASDSSGGAASGTPVKLPELGESVTEGTVTRWLKAVGDEVAVDEALLEVSTDKVDTEIPSPVAGTLLEITVNEDETVEVGAQLGVIGSGQPAKTPAAQPEPEPEAEPERESKPEAAPEPAAAPEPKPTPEPTPAKATPAPPSGPTPAHADASGDGGRTYVTPLVRKLADQHGVDLASLSGTGVGGRIRKQDVLDAAKSAQEAPAPAAVTEPAQPAATRSVPAPKPSPLRGRTEPLSRLRKIIAQRMIESLQASAQLTQVVEVDMTRVARLRDATKADFLAREGVKLSYLPFFAKAAIDGLKEHPSLNATIDTEAGTVTYYDRENVAFAVDTEKGLLTPVVKDAGDLSIAGLAKKIADVAGRTRTNKIGPDELSGGTFTITNLGSVGALWDTPIINQPQVAILGPGAIVKRPVVIDDPDLGETIAVRHMVYLALTYDHRLVDGADAGRFLQTVKARLEAAQFEI